MPGSWPGSNPPRATPEMRAALRWLSGFMPLWLEYPLYGVREAMHEMAESNAPIDRNE